MPFNGTGLFQRVYSWVVDAAGGLFIDSTRMDTDTDDIAAGLSNCVTRDGQSPWLNNLPAGGFKITGLANGSAPGDSVNFNQVFTNPTFNGLTANLAVSFAGATTVTVPTVTAGDSSTKAASTAFVQATAFSAALPAQAGNAGKFVVTNGLTASWSETFGVAVNEIKGADIASAATINLTTATGNLVHITGTTTITAITIPSGAEREIVFDGILTLTHNAVSLILPGGANITTAPGDVATVRGDGGGNARVVNYERASGRALVVTTPGMVKLAGPTVPSATNTLDFLTTFSANAASFNSFRAIIEGFLPSANDDLSLRFANGGAVDTGNKYYDTTIGGATDSTASGSISIQGGDFIAAGAGKGVSLIIDFVNVNDATNLKIIHCMRTWFTVGGALAVQHIAGGYDSANAVSGFRLYWDTVSTTFTVTGSITIFGYNRS